MTLRDLLGKYNSDDILEGFLGSLQRSVRDLKRAVVLYCNVKRTVCQPEFEFVVCDIKSTVLLLLILVLIFTDDTCMVVVGV